VIHVLQAQEQQILMREDHVVEGTLLHTSFEVKNYKMTKYNQKEQHTSFSILFLLQEN